MYALNGKIIENSKKGTLAKDKDADSIVFDEDIKICNVFIGGKKVCFKK